MSIIEKTGLEVLKRVCVSHMSKLKLTSSNWGHCQKCKGYKTCPNFVRSKVLNP